MEKGVYYSSCTNPVAVGKNTTNLLFIVIKRLESIDFNSTISQSNLSYTRSLMTDTPWNFSEENILPGLNTV